MHVFLIAICGAAGALLRYGVNEASQRMFGPDFAVGTLIVNVVGCLLLGVVGEMASESTLSPAVQRGISVGLLGALTTFSTFGHETFRHFEREEYLLAGGNVVANLVLGLFAVWLGVMLVRQFQG